MEYLLAIGIAMFAGLLLSRLTSKLNLPDVTSYLVAGVLVGPFVLGRLNIPGLGFNTLELVEGSKLVGVESLKLICEVALGFIAFSIGSEFRVSALRKTGRQATVIAIIQALTATLFVDAALIGLHFILGEEKLPISTCLILGAIATATAPAATLMVVNQYKARGPLTDILLPVVALDDAVGLIVFAVSKGIATAFVSGELSVISLLVNPTIEILGSLVLGAALGWVFSWVEKHFNSNSKRLSLAVTFVVLCAALAKLHWDIGEVHIGFSSLLVCMMCGTIFCNLCDFSEEIMHKTERWTGPVYVLFFVISGAELDLSVFMDVAVVGIGVLYILARSAGKIVGASASARLMKCQPSICKYLGITLLPQAGVALGMTVTVADEFPGEGAMIRNIVLFSVLIYELVGPLLTKMALTAAGDIRPKPTVDRQDLQA